MNEDKPLQNNPSYNPAYDFKHVNKDKPMQNKPSFNLDKPMQNNPTW